MSRRLPPLSAIQGFEAAARHLSFKAAAEELNLTQSAVSHQVRALEDFLGVGLFERHANRIALTEAGLAYLGEVTGILEDLRASTARAQGSEERQGLSVRGTPAFIARWLLPRLDGFASSHPGLELRLTTGLPPTDFSGGDADVIFHWCQEPIPGVRVDPFLASSRYPVCSPGLLAEAGPFREPRDLGRTTLLRDLVQDGWRSWLERAGAGEIAHDRGPRFEHCELTYGAAERGLGVALAYGVLVERDLAEGRLVRLFETETEPVVIYSIACLEGRAEVPKIAAFREWVLAEAGLRETAAAKEPTVLHAAE